MRTLLGSAIGIYTPGRETTEAGLGRGRFRCDVSRPLHPSMPWLPSVIGCGLPRGDHGFGEVVLSPSRSSATALL